MFIIKINWSLYNENKLIIEKKGIVCSSSDNNVINFIDDTNTYNIVDLNNETFIRENQEFLFEINFRNSTFIYILKEKNIKLENSIKCYLDKNNKNIELKYNLDEEEKKIIIQIL